MKKAKRCTCVPIRYGMNAMNDGLSNALCPVHGDKKEPKTKWSKAARLLERAEAMEEALGEIRATCIVNQKRHSKKTEPLFHELANIVRKMADRGLKTSE